MSISAYDLLRQQDISQALDIIINWNTSTSTTESSLASSLVKIRNQPVPELNSNLPLRKQLLKQTISIICSDRLRSQCIDYASRALDKICKRILEESPNKDDTSAYNYSLRLFIDFMCTQSQNDEGGSSSNANFDLHTTVNDSAYNCAVNMPWTEVFTVVSEKLTNELVLQLFADRMKLKCDEVKGESMGDEKWYSLVLDPLFLG